MNVNNISRRTLAIGSIALVIVICGLYIGFMQQFIEYALDMLYLASKASTHYLTAVPLQINH
jgi:putative Mn2+ efflux pump MntP